MRSLLAYCLICYIAAPLLRGAEIDELLSKQQESLKEIRSLHLKSQNVRTIAAGLRESVKSVKASYQFEYWAKGDLYIFDLSDAAARKNVEAQRVGFNGAYWQNFTNASAVLELKRGPIPGDIYLPNFDAFVMPFAFLKEEKGPSSNSGIMLKDLHDSDLWNRVKKSVKFVGKSEINGVHTDIVEILGGQDRFKSLPFVFRVHLAPELGGYPVGWDKVFERDKVIMSYRVQEVGYATDPETEKKYPFPKKATVVVSRPSGEAVRTNEYTITTLEVNQIKDDNIFTIDPAKAKLIYDMDTNTYIKTVPEAPVESESESSDY